MTKPMTLPALTQNGFNDALQYRFVDLDGKTALRLDCADVAFVRSHKIGVAGLLTVSGATFTSLQPGSTALFNAARVAVSESKKKLIWFVELSGNWEFDVQQRFTLKQALRGVE